MGQFTRSLTDNAVYAPVAGDTRDCKRGVAPFNTSAYYDPSRGTPSQYWNPGFGSGQCQTGDSGSKLQNFDLQLFDNDGSDLVIEKATPLPGCHYRLLTSSAAYNPTKNTWTNLCTFTPTQTGVYPFEVRNSGLDGVADLTTMTGWNAFSLRITGAPSARLYPVGDSSVWMNTVGSQPRLYLAEIGPEHKGRHLYIDLFDVGDGSGASAFQLQVKGPAAGAPLRVPGEGTTIPASGVANWCVYNATKSVSRGPATPDVATNCRVQTKAAGSSVATYNDGWLRITIKLAEDYDCGPATAVPDCWWSLAYDFGTSSFPSDRMVYRVTVG